MEEQTNEIVPGMTVEEIRALYFNADALKEPPYRVFQLNSNGHRYYYRFMDGEPEFYPSVTTLLKQTMPTPPALLEWMMANGKDSTEKRDLAAAYGTFMHMQFERLILSRGYDFDKVPDVLSNYLAGENIDEGKVFSEWLPKIRKDVLAFAQFILDYNVTPLAIEIALVHPEFHYAGCLDLPCIMTDPKTGEQFPAIVDFKSGRKGFYEEHELQLHLYMAMWNANFPDCPISRVFNFSPKDWRTKPTYNLKEQTDSVNAKKLPHLLALAGIEDAKRDNTLTIVHGELDLDKGKIMDNVLNLSLADLIIMKTGKKEEPRPMEKEPEASTAPQTFKKGRKMPVEAKKEGGAINSPSKEKSPATIKIGENLLWDGQKLLWKEETAPDKDNLLNDEIEL